MSAKRARRSHVKTSPADQRTVAEILTEPVAPLGLRLALGVVADECPMGRWPTAVAGQSYLAAQRILDGVGKSDDNGAVISDEVERTARRLFLEADTDPAFEVGFMTETSFMVGFAACWLVMTSMGGPR